MYMLNSFDFVPVAQFKWNCDPGRLSGESFHTSSKFLRGVVAYGDDGEIVWVAEWLCSSLGMDRIPSW